MAYSHSRYEVGANRRAIIPIQDNTSNGLLLAAAGLLEEQISTLKKSSSSFTRQHIANRWLLERYAQANSVKVRYANTRDVVLITAGVVTPNPVLDAIHGVFHPRYCPVDRHVSEPVNATVLIPRVTRKAHWDSPAIMVRMRSVTVLSSASISASGRGGVNT